MAVGIKALTAYVRALDSALDLGTRRAIAAATESAYREAVSRAKKQFNNTPGRDRTGELSTSIVRGIAMDQVTGYVAVRARYGAIQELGGSVVPKSAKHLWVKNYVGVDTRFKRWTPRDFIAAMQGLKRNQVGPAKPHARAAARDKFFITYSPHTGRLMAAFEKAAGGRRKHGPAQIQLLFSLVDRVTLPARPFIRPAVQAAVRSLPALIKQYAVKEGKGP